MGVDLLAKYLGDASESSIEPNQAGPCFTLAPKPPRYLVFEYDEGCRTALAYAQLQAVTFEPNKGITLRFGTTTVTIAGLRLKPAFQSFMDHLVRRCAEGNERAGGLAGFPAVTKIEIEFS